MARYGQGLEAWPGTTATRMGVGFDRYFLEIVVAIVVSLEILYKKIEGRVCPNIFIINS